MVLTDGNSAPSVWREVASVYGFAGIMFALAIIPGLNFSYSGHGGISWLVVPFCFPYVVFRAARAIAKSSGDSRRWYVRFFAASIPIYILLAIPLSWAAAASLRTTFGLEVSTWTFFATMICPVPWWYLKGIWASLSGA